MNHKNKKWCKCYLLCVMTFIRYYVFTFKYLIGIFKILVFSKSIEYWHYSTCILNESRKRNFHLFMITHYFAAINIFHTHINTTWAYFIISLNFKLCKNKIICMSNLLFWRFQLSLAWWFRISSVSMSVSLLQTYLHSRLQVAIVCMYELKWCI